MSIELKITATDAADLRAKLSAFLGMAPVVSTIAAVTDEPAKRGPGRPPKAETPVTEPVVTKEYVARVEEQQVEINKAVEAEVTTDGADEAITYDGHLKPAVLKVSAKHGRAGVEKLLASFDVDHTSKVPESRWAEFLVEATKMAN